MEYYERERWADRHPVLADVRTFLVGVLVVVAIGAGLWWMTHDDDRGCEAGEHCSHEDRERPY